MILSMFESIRGYLLKKRLPKLVFLKTVSFTMVANSEKMKMKKSHSPYDLCLFPFGFSNNFFRKLLPLPNFFISLRQKNG